MAAEGDRAVMKCPSCDGEDLEVAIPANIIRQEIYLRERFVLNRIAEKVTFAELKDRMDFVHNSNVDILPCTRCHVLLRKMDEGNFKKRYEEDSYDDHVMEYFLKIYIETFREKESFYRVLLPKGANVLEIGSYVGGFLHVAREWGWRATGLDIGRDISRFTNAKGYTTYAQPLEECYFPNKSFDGVFIWNCFEQIIEPHASLEKIKSILKPNGVLVIRIPNGLFYRLCEIILEVRRNSSSQLDDGDLIIKALGYNGLLGFPYQYGYSSPSLSNLVQQYGFQLIGMLNSTHITLPLPKTSEWAIEEKQKILGMLQNLAQSFSKIYPDSLAGPWMEISYRKISV